MKIVTTGNISRIFSDDLETYDKLPLGYYRVCFSPTMGIYLEKDVNIKKESESIYGTMNRKIDKVLRGYNYIKAPHSYGIVLTGAKGTGKTMFARKIAERIGLPVLIVTEGFPGLVSFLQDIEQEVLIIFDEFEKNFSAESYNEDFPQTNFLPLFDGLSGSKKFFIIIANNQHDINKYLLGRPGRFHYHFKVKAPSISDMKCYLMDHLKNHELITDSLLNALATMSLSYDGLRALCAELDAGYSLEETIEDLNIDITMPARQKYHITCYTDNPEYVFSGTGYLAFPIVANDDIVLDLKGSEYEEQLKVYFKKTVFTQDPNNPNKYIHIATNDGTTKDFGYHFSIKDYDNDLTERDKAEIKFLRNPNSMITKIVAQRLDDSFEFNNFYKI